MNPLAPTDELVNRAFRLAYFILGDRTSSTYVAMAALDRLNAAASVQDRRRLYYVPTGRPEYPASRTKVSLGRLHLLQRLIFVESEPFERLIEAREGSLRQQDMIIRFVKHLVRITTKRNSFYVALGQCRLLHNYATPETIEVYNLVVQDPQRGKDDYYYRSRKKKLMGELAARFGGSLTIRRGYRGEERFRAQEDSGRYSELVRECLRRFMPWGSSCVLPSEIEPTKNVISDLHFNGTDPDLGHEVELNRIHTLLHPDCFERVATTVGLDPPARRLELPYFVGAGEGSGPTEDRLNPPELSEGEIVAVRRHLDRNAALRKASSHGALSVLVDGERQRRIVHVAAGVALVGVADGDELIEFRREEGDEEIALALHPLRYGERGGLAPSSSVLTAPGWKISFAVRAVDGFDEEPADAVVSVNYEQAVKTETNAHRLRRLAARLYEMIGARRHATSGYLKPTLICLALACCVVGLLFYFHLRDARPAGELIAEHKESGAQEGRVAQPSPVASPRAQQDEHTGSVTHVAPSPRASNVSPVHGAPERTLPSAPATQPPAKTATPKDVRTTRGRGGAQESATLLAIKLVYVDPLKGDPTGGRLRDELVKSLRASGRFVVVESRDSADAVFKGYAEQSGENPEAVSVSLRLVNADGQVVWPASSAMRMRKYRGVPSDAAGEFVKDLLADIERLEKGR